MDFGGGEAHGLSNLSNSSPHIKFSYHLVETTAMTRLMKPVLAPLGYSASDKIPSKMPKPLIINAINSIQYLTDYGDALAKLAALSPDAMLIGCVR